MLRLGVAVCVGFSLCCLSSVVATGDDDRNPRAESRAAQREFKGEQSKREQSQRSKKRKKRQPKQQRPKKPLEKVPEKLPAANDVDPRAAKPAPPRPKKTPPAPTEAKPADKPVEPLPPPVEKVEAAKPPADDTQPIAADFALQGEYLGVLQSGPRAGRAGLQVVALGEGKFEAYLLEGGLPGNGWLRGSPRPKLTGERDGASAALRGEVGSVSIDGMTATILSDDGRAVGELQKVLRRSPTMGAAPAASAKVLFNGKSTAAFKSAKLTDDGLLGVGALTQEPVGDFRMHLEFRTPFEPQKRGQGRGNSGVYIQERYEVQVLDSFGLAGDANECGGLYRQRKPDFNLCLPPMSWQTYDIHFTAARFDAQGNKIANARITLFHNGIAVHDNVELTGKTGAGQKEEPTPRPIRFQDHGNAVVYRNIWLVAGQGRGALVEATCCEDE